MTSALPLEAKARGGEVSTTVLLVEDDRNVRPALSRGLTREGATVVAVETGVEAIRAVTSERPDVILLDLGLPDLDGSEVLAIIRSSSDVPVVVATARDDEKQIVKLLDAGADDYLVKPFSAEHAMARIRAVLRRVSDGTPEKAQIVLGKLLVDPGARTATLGGRPLPLSRKEFDLLAALSTRPGEVISKRRLLAEVWQTPWGGADRTVDVHLSWLRRKLGETAADPRYIHTVRGVGVKIVAPDTDHAP